MCMFPNKGSFSEGTELRLLLCDYVKKKLVTHVRGGQAMRPALFGLWVKTTEAPTLNTYVKQDIFPRNIFFLFCLNWFQ